VQEIPRRDILATVVAPGAYEPAERLEYVGIVVDEKDGEGSFAHFAATMALCVGNCVGSRMIARAPLVSLLTMRSSPPWALMMVEQIESPRPRPCSLVVWNGSNRRPCCSGAMPRP